MYAYVLLMNYLHTPTKIGTKLSLQAIQYFVLCEHPAESYVSVIKKQQKRGSYRVKEFSKLISLMKN